MRGGAEAIATCPDLSPLTVLHRASGIGRRPSLHRLTAVPPEPRTSAHRAGSTRHRASRTVRAVEPED